MLWIWWAVTGYFLNATAITIDKTLLGRKELKDPAVYTLLISALGLLVFVLEPWGLTWPKTSVLVTALLSGAAFTLGLWLMFRVLQRGEASRVPAFIGSLNPIFVLIGSYLLLNERLGMVSLAAFLFLVLGGFMMIGGHGGLGRRDLWLAVWSSMAFGVAYVLLKSTFDDTNFISGLIWSRTGGFLASLLLWCVPGTFKNWQQSLHSGGQVKLIFLVGQVAAAAGGLFNSYAITLASVTLVNAVQGVQYVFLLVMALVVSWQWPKLFRDEFTGEVLLRKIIGTVLIVGGLWFLSLSV